MIKMIAFDADDTLWHNETLYQDAQTQLEAILMPWSAVEQTRISLAEIELDNLSLYGYGIKAFTLSMVEAALKVSQGQLNPGAIREILDIGRSMLQADVRLLPKVEEALRTLSRTHPLMVITKGDLLDQTSKIARSGLEDYFSLVEVLNQKTPEDYQQILDKYHLSIKNFLMVGNSLRSDVAPVLALGGTAVHIPTDSTWEHEMLDGFDHDQEGFYEIEDIQDLPTLVESIDK
jgi:putative hydrolase of the HAD superfamily